MFKKLLLTVTLCLTAVFAHAAEYTAIVKTAQCTMVAKSDSALGTMVGTAGGAAGGAMVGNALFGKTGKLLGGLVGSVAGGYAGNEVASSKTYNCLVMIQNQQGKDVYVETIVPKPIAVGRTIQVFEGQDGKIFIR